MPQVYTVATNNAFAAFDDNSDGEAILPAQQQSPQQQPAQQQPQAQAQQAPQRQQQQPQQPQGKRPARPRQDKKPGEAAAGEESPSGPKFNNRSGAPQRRTRGGRDLKGQSEIRLDRHSGTGRGKEMKKEGGGAHNWGNEPADFGADEAAAAAGAGTATGVAQQPAGATTPGTEQTPAPAGPTGPQEESKLTYSDYLQQQAENQAFAPREETKSSPKVEPGMRVYTKEISDKTRVGRASNSAVTTKSVAETATRQDVQLRYQGRQRRENNNNSNPSSSENNTGARRRNNRDSSQPQQSQSQQSQSQPQQQSQSQSQQAQQNARERNIDLKDKQAFPTLQAH